MVETSAKPLRLLPLGFLPDAICRSDNLRTALVGLCVHPSIMLQSVHAYHVGQQIVLRDAARCPIRLICWAELSVHAQGGQRTWTWHTPLMVLENGQVLVVASPRAPHVLLVDTIKITSTAAPDFGPPTGVVRGTRIATPTGLAPVQKMRRGDLVLTADQGPQRLVSVDVVRPPDAPQQIEIDRTIIGPAMPTRRLTIAPGTLILTRNSIVTRMFDVPDLFLQALRLVDLHGVRLLHLVDQPIYQLRFAAPQVFFANGVAIGSTPHAGEERSPHARMIPSEPRQKALVLRMWRNGARACSGDSPARSRTERHRQNNATRRGLAAALVQPHVAHSPDDFNVVPNAPP